jgi:hypothetical protein
MGREPFGEAVRSRGSVRHGTACRSFGVVLAAALALLGACGPTVSTLHEPAAAAAVESDGPLRVHTLDGMLYVLETWDVADDSIRGAGRRYDADRAAAGDGTFIVPVTNVAVLETRDVDTPVAGLAVMTTASVGSLAGTIACAVNPKACFGSCPTFYVDLGERPEVQAEGFSTSVARILEDDDLDMLPDAHAIDGVVALEMRNEALESHAIRSLELLWADGPAGTEVAATPAEEFLVLGPGVAPSACTGAGDDCLDRLGQRDGREATWEADPEDLAAKTEVFLSFAAPGASDAALDVTARNTLMSTFVMYEVLARFGADADEFLARVERAEEGATLGLLRFGLLLGGIEVAVRRGERDWEDVGTFGFTGPIARERLVFRVAVNDPTATVAVRLRFPRAHWRIDRVALAPVAEEVEPRSAAPAAMERDGIANEAALQSVLGLGPRLVTFPGDTWVVRFAVPPAGDRSRTWFLRSRGYYYEWIRESWLADQDVETAERYLRDPAAALRELAPRWNGMAGDADALFEASRFSGVRP